MPGISRQSQYVHGRRLTILLRELYAIWADSRVHSVCVRFVGGHS